ncbi:trypsin-like peptidase domain-containing protein [Paenibacillus sp. J5C_2022]|uniref:S1C family serine protease n=1 Tax=Paenibacillus sp. J5C2022 TaxID=2977129 RepID=UPI0021CEA9E2|nr:trypsin-like peptidase domain-containing protein [Paenibacillus sp. J5C2022]MCU6709870.1 trypsin-like peptidase domain-containing protein [Paenibacillus sp. J5C2022]
MNDQNNNNKPYDDFFKPNNENQSEREREENGNASTGQDADSKPSYYYSYGPMSGEQSSPQPYPHAQARPPYAHRQQQEQPQQATYEQSAQSAEQPHAQQHETSPYMHQGEQQRQLRPFQPGGASGKSGWQAKKEKPRSSFKSMFLSFLAGVLVVGGLMYTADVQNWFSPDASTLETQGSGSGSGTEAPPSSNGGTTTAVAGMQDRPDNISELFESASPAVVKVETYTKMQNRSNSGSLFDDPFFRQFFGDGGSQQEQQQPESNNGQMVQTGIGTGFFFDEQGYILTNQHVVGTADQIKVTVQGYDEPFIAEPLGSSYELDLAVLKIKGDKQFPTLPLGDSDHSNIGDWVVAIGNPHGFDHTITVGVLSAKERPIDIPDQQGDRHYKHLLQTDASINPGNSGGPLLNMNGEVIGINTAVSAQAQGIGFAIPTSTVQAVLEDLKSNKEPAVPFIGADLAQVTEEIAKQLELDKAEGSLVVGVYFKTPAYHAGLKQYDVIVGINGESFSKRDDLIDAIQTKDVGETITLNILRQGEKLDIQLEVGDKKEFGQ